MGKYKQEGPSVQIPDLIIPKIITGWGGTGCEATDDFRGNSLLVLFLYCYVLYFERDILLTIIALKSRIAHGSLNRLKDDCWNAIA